MCKTGPKIEPCGTPFIIDTEEDDYIIDLNTLSSATQKIDEIPVWTSLNIMKYRNRIVIQNIKGFGIVQRN